MCYNKGTKGKGNKKMNYPMNFDMSVAELIDACDKPANEMWDTCENCILLKMCCWYYRYETTEEENE